MHRKPRRKRRPPQMRNPPILLGRPSPTPPRKQPQLRPNHDLPIMALFLSKRNQEPHAHQNKTPAPHQPNPPVGKRPVNSGKPPKTKARKSSHDPPPTTDGIGKSAREIEKTIAPRKPPPRRRGDTATKTTDGTPRSSGQTLCPRQNTAGISEPHCRLRFGSSTVGVPGGGAARAIALFLWMSRISLRVQFGNRYELSILISTSDLPTKMSVRLTRLFAEKCCAFFGGGRRQRQNAERDGYGDGLPEICSTTPPSVPGWSAFTIR